MNTIDNYMTPAEAAYRWGLPQETVKSRLKPSLYKEQIDEMLNAGLIKFFQHPDGKRREWIVTVQAMEKWFGPKKKVVDF
ncbi:helix-turn-helix domain-containing protein [Paenibacillus macerans]|uniref:helix-turn-helix domain-containing protein n=1 Tax=Paenibacillus macerans TaxID=44252 RepID=UPI002DBDFE49|nr:helix-turn-helix domain-containing protein [Paenibacillus macerans]MEC0139720.1 helix-turn-helix domain-containing protein [Paenibacillus macerans]